MKMSRYYCILVVLFKMLWAGGCVAPNEQLSFPTAPLTSAVDEVWYDVDENGKRDFGLLNDGAGRLRVLAYDDNEDGRIDRIFRLDDYDPELVPHLIVMLDSIPFQHVADRYASGDWRSFAPPQKLIPPFPTMSGLIFSAILHTPPLPGVINRHYDQRSGETVNDIWRRAFGRENAWQQRLDYHAAYWENGLSFVWPRPWYQAELVRVKHAFDESPHRVTIVYIASTSGMLSRFGEAGLNETLDGMSQLSLQLLYERRGAVNISFLADHGHNLMPGKRVSLEDTLEAAGLHPGDKLIDHDDVVIECDGMVNYIGIHTHEPQRAADALLQRDEVQLVMYQEGDRVIVRDRTSAAAIERCGARFRYVSLEGDPLDHQTVMADLAERGLGDAEGFIEDQVWFEATIDHRWPDAPRRLWDGFHGSAVSTPQLMLTLNDGYFTGLGELEFFITMASTHGGFDQTHSASFVMSTLDRVNRPLRSRDVLEAIEPGIITILESDR